MRILVTNDDGVHSAGLWSLADALKAVGRVSIVAPDRDMSGVGTAMTLLTVLRAQEVQSKLEGVDAAAVQGTPSDCVILATESLHDEPFDLVVSGVNQGANMGLDVVSSGTVGAAMQGCIRGIPSIAISVASLTDVAFEAASRTAKALAPVVAARRAPQPPLVNVNLPNAAPEEIKGVRVTTLGPRAYLESVARGQDGRRTHYWIKHDRPVGADAGQDTDVWAVRNGWASISSIGWGPMDGVPRQWLDQLPRLVADELGIAAASESPLTN